MGRRGIHRHLAGRSASGIELGDYDDLSDVTSVVNHREYNSFGVIESESDSSKEFMYGYTGRIYDTDIDLYDYRGRIYDAVLKRFISEDPLGFEAGDANLSRYVGNNVPNATDPSGLWRWDNDWVETIIGTVLPVRERDRSAAYSFWVTSGGGKLKEIGGGAKVLIDGDGEVARQQMIRQMAQHYERQIEIHKDANGGNVHKAIDSATGWQIVGGELVGLRDLSDAWDGYDSIQLKRLEGVDRTKKTLEGTSKFTGSVAFIGGTGQSLAVGYTGGGLGNEINSLARWATTYEGVYATRVVTTSARLATETESATALAPGSSAYNGKHFGEVLGAWSRKNGFVPNTSAYNGKNFGRVLGSWAEKNGHVPVREARTLFRGDRSSRTPDLVFEQGIKQKGLNTDLLWHAQASRPDTFYIPTSLYPKIAKGFAGKNGYLFVVRSKRGIDLNATLGSKSPFPEQMEFSIPGGVSYREVMGAFRMKNGEIVGDFIPNPSFVKPK